MPTNADINSNAIIFFAICIAALFAAVVVLSICLFRKKKQISRINEENALFLSMTAHDLRSPLTNIKGFADAMISGNIPEEKREESLSLISLEADRLARLSSRLCDAGKKDLSFSVFGICDMLCRILLLLERKISARGLKTVFEPQDEIYVRADSDAIFEALYNICDNAVKYSTDGGDITFAAKIDKDKCFISVKNRAVVSREDAKRLFEAGFRADSSKKNTSGSGLGLYIARELINAHGVSELSVSTDSDNGYCEFYFFLELADDEAV